MPIKLFTGLPGAGKTACMVAALLDYGKHSPDRPLYQFGINGLADGVAETLTEDQLKAWWELPPGAVIAIDEAQEDGSNPQRPVCLMPLDMGKPAPWVKRISTVRHEGMDFLLTTQHPGMISSHVRRLVDHHVHAVRKFNTSVVQRFTWGRCMENCEKASAQKAAVQSVGTLPAKVFDLYKSSNVHNMKARVPAKVYFLAVLGLVFVGALIALPMVLSHMRHSAQSIAKVPEKRDAMAARDTGLRQTDYAKWMAPRIPGLPWTAPAYDHLQVKANPRVFCIAVEDGSTHCVTEQGTDLDVPPAVARQIAAHGVYDPFLDPQRDRADTGQERRGREQQPQSMAPQAPAAAAPAPPPSSGAVGALGSLAAGGLHAAYFPPQSTPRNPEEILQ